MDACSQVAVMLLVGMIGAQLDLKTMVRRSSTVLRVSAGGLFVPLALGLGAGFLLPRNIWPAGVDRTTFAVFLGVTMCVSAIPVIAKTLADLHLLHRDVGQLILASAAVQDTAGWLLLSLVSALAVGALGPGAVLASLIRLLAFIAVAALARPPLVRLILRTAAPAAARFSKLNHWEGLALGAGLNARGVVEIVIATVGLRLGVLSVASYTIVVLVAVLTSVMAPPFLRWAMARIEHTADERLTQADITAPAGLPPAHSRDQP